MANKNKGDRPRPLWILKIHKRLSVKKFKRCATYINKMDKEDVSWVLKGCPKQSVYQVTVETMENCGTTECEQKIWIPDDLAKATGEMLDDFEEEISEISEVSSHDLDDDGNDNEISDDSMDSMEIEEVYAKLCNEESFNPYASSSDDDDDDDDDVDLDDEKDKNSVM